MFKLQLITPVLDPVNNFGSFLMLCNFSCYFCQSYNNGTRLFGFRYFLTWIENIVNFNGFVCCPAKNITYFLLQNISLTHEAAMSVWVLHKLCHQNNHLFSSQTSFWIACYVTFFLAGLANLQFFFFSYHDYLTWFLECHE